jgi:hypothetical protein
MNRTFRLGLALILAFGFTTTSLQADDAPKNPYAEKRAREREAARKAPIPPGRGTVASQLTCGSDTIALELKQFPTMSGPTVEQETVLFNGKLVHTGKMDDKPRLLKTAAARPREIMVGEPGENRQPWTLPVSPSTFTPEEFAAMGACLQAKGASAQSFFRNHSITRLAYVEAGTAPKKIKEVLDFKIDREKALAAGRQAVLRKNAKDRYFGYEQGPGHIESIAVTGCDSLPYRYVVLGYQDTNNPEFWLVVTLQSVNQEEYRYVADVVNKGPPDFFINQLRNITRNRHLQLAGCTDPDPHPDVEGR